MAEDRRLTLAGCIRRDTLAQWRGHLPGTSAGAAFEQYLRASCRGVRETLAGALRSEPWLSIGPLRPQIRLRKPDRLFSVGNAAGETHPLIGEGMSMALQSAFLLAGYLIKQPARAIDATRALEIHQAYRSAWRMCLCNAAAPRGNLRAHRDAPGAEPAGHKVVGELPSGFDRGSSLGRQG
jgi:2-polyprenyl-6-methoxyphenol hydroxylase-like FAD-dependent oxidoreductase